jgi:hypothetical protein
MERLGNQRRVDWTPTRPAPFPSAEWSQRGHGCVLSRGGRPIPRCLAPPLVSGVVCDAIHVVPVPDSSSCPCSVGSS